MLVSGRPLKVQLQPHIVQQACNGASTRKLVNIDRFNLVNLHKGNLSMTDGLPTGQTTVAVERRRLPKLHGTFLKQAQTLCLYLTPANLWSMHMFKVTKLRMCYKIL